MKAHLLKHLLQKLAWIQNMIMTEQSVRKPDHLRLRALKKTPPIH